MKKSRSLQGFLLILIIGAILVFVNLIANQEYVKLDLTAQKLFTLDPVSKKILGNLSDNCNITVYLSRELPVSEQSLDRVVRDKLDAFKEIAGDKLHYRIIRVADNDTTVAAELRKEGIRQVQVGEQSKTKVGVQLIWKTAKVDYLGGSRNVVLNEHTIEYDLLSAVKMLSDDRKQKVGIIVSFADPKLEEQDRKSIEARVNQLWNKISASYPDMDKQSFLETKLQEYESSLPSTRKERFLSDFSSAGVLMLLSQHFDIRILDISDRKSYEWDRILDTMKNLQGENPMQREDKSTILARMFGRAFDEIPEDLDLLVIYQPKYALGEENLKVVNDFVMKGKPLLCLVDQTRPASMYNTKFGLDRDLDINDLLVPYGARIEDALVMDKQCVQKDIPILENMRVRNVPVFLLYQPILYTFDRENPITRNFRAMVFDSVSPVDISPADSIDGVTAAALLVSSEESRIETGNDLGGMGNLIPLAMVQDLDDQSFPDSHVPLAASLEGIFPSAFPEKGGKAEEDAENGQDSLVVLAENHGVDSAAVLKSPAGTRLAVIGDADFVNMGGGDNFNFLLNVMEWLTKDDYSLASLRGKEFMLNMIPGDLSESTESWIEVMNIVLMPVLILILWIAGWLLRNHRKKKAESSH
jgi:ABC-type uncharacterized transport system involved in gliding motility auxiliary subunit